MLIQIRRKMRRGNGGNFEILLSSAESLIHSVCKNQRRSLSLFYIQKYMCEVVEEEIV